MFGNAETRGRVREPLFLYQYKSRLPTQKLLGQGQLHFLDDL